MDTTSYLKAAIDSIGLRWHEGLKDLKQIDDDDAKQMHTDYLDELYQEAVFLYEQYDQYIHPIQLGQLKHIINYNNATTRR